MTSASSCSGRASSRTSRGSRTERAAGDFPAYRLTLWNREASPSAVRSLLAQPGVRVLSSDGKVYAFLRPA